MSSSRFDLNNNKDFGIQLTDAQLRLKRDRAYNSYGAAPETHVNNVPVGRSIELTESQSSVSTGAKSGDDENSAKMLRKVLNSSNKRNSTGVASNADQKARLRKILEKRSGRAKSAPQPPKQQLNIPVHATPNPYAVNRPPPLQQPVSNSHGSSRQPPLQQQRQHQPTTIPPTLGDNSASTKNSKEDQKALLRKVLAKSRAKRQNVVETRISPRSGLIQAQKRNLLDDEPKDTSAAAKSQEPTTRDFNKGATYRDYNKATGPARDSTFVFDQPPPMPARAPRQHVPSNTRMSPRSSLMMSQKKSFTSSQRGQEREPLAAMSKKEEPTRQFKASVPRRDSSLIDRKQPLPPASTPAFESSTDTSSRARKSGVAPQAPSKAESRSLFGRRAPPSTLQRATNAASIRRSNTFDRISPTKFKLPSPEEDLDSYSAFFSVLQKEGAGDHRELWQSFRSMFHGGDSPVTEKKKRVKFDSKTKKELTEMNLHLKRTSKIECKAETQLVNDKKLAKLGGRVPQTRQPSKLDVGSLQQFQVGISQSEESETHSEANSHHQSVASSHHMEASQPEQSSAVEIQRVQLRHVEPKKASSDKPTQKTWLASFNAKQKRKSAMPSRAEEIQPEPVETTEERVPPSRQESWLTAHRQKQDRARSNPLQTEVVARSPSHNSISEEVLSPNSLSGRKRAIDDRPAPAPWGKVQLKSTRATMSPDRVVTGFTSPAFKKVQLRETKHAAADEVDPVEVPDKNDVPVDHSKIEHSVIAHPLDVQHAEPHHVMATPPRATQLFQSKTTSKKNHVAHSFVPSPSFAKVQLRPTKRPVVDDVKHVDFADENDVPEEDSKTEHSVLARPLDDNNSLKSHNVMATPPRAPGHVRSKTTSKKNQTVQSFVPAASDGTASWTRVKLRQSGGNDTSFERQEPSSPVVPWLNVKLRKLPDTKVETEKEPTDAPHRQETHNIDAENILGDQLEETSTQPKAEAETKEIEESNDDAVSKSDARNALANMFAARQAPPPEEPTLSSKEEEPSKADIQGALGSMFAARLCPPSPLRQETSNEEKVAPVEKPSPSEIKNALSNMFAARLGPPASQEEKTDTAVTASEKPSPSDIKNALSNMFAARLGPPVEEDKTDDAQKVIKAGSEIDLDNLSVELQELLDNFVVVDLWGIPGMPCEAVVLGKELILISVSEPKSAKTRVTWVLERDSIESITLDMARNVADLMLADDAQKSLKFKSVEGCLRFASCFYQAPNAAPAEAASPHVEIPHAEPASTLSKDSNDSSAQELLSEEEQQLLMRYREARKMKGPDDAMKDTIGSGVSSAGSSLSEDDQNTVDKYKKMLKMRIPPEAVQHKMTKDGVDPKLADLVLNNDAHVAPETKSASSSRGNGLTAEEQTIADKFLKMIKMRIPPEAVEHKMVKEGTDRKIIDVVLNNGKPTQEAEPSKSAEPAPKVDLSEEETKQVSSFRKMLKMCIPPDAVRHRMKKENVSSKVLFAVFPEDAKAAEAKAKSDSTAKLSLTADETKIAAKFQKMLKMRIPPEAVRHKMAKEGVNQKIVAVVLGEEPKAKSQNELSPEEAASVASFKKMLKMNLPEAAVRHKMQKEGASAKVISAVFGTGNTASTKKAPTQGKKPELRGSKLVALHWTPITGEELDNSVWRANKKRKVTTATPETNDISKLIELFKKKSNPKGGASAVTANKSDTTGKAKLIDLNRANNIAISLKAFKEFTHKQLAETIDHLDPQDLITGERIQFIKDILPTVREGQAVQNFKGDDSRLVAAEHFFKHIVPVKRIEVKVEIMQTMVTFRANASSLVDCFQVLERACNQVQNSEKLTDVLDMVLHVGNIMNEGTRTGGASGFKFDSLLKLTQTKSSDGKTTVLDYLVMIFVAKNKRATLDIKADFQDCQSGSRMLVSDMNGEAKAMQDALKKCKTELATLKKETGKIAGDKLAASEVPAVNGRAGLFAAIHSLGEKQEDDEGQKLGSEKSPLKRGAANSYLDAIKAKQEEEKKVEEEGQKPGKLNLDSIKGQCALKAENEGGASSLFKALTSCTNPELDDERGSVSEGEADQAKTPLSPEKPKREATLDAGIQKLEDFITEADNTLAKLKDDKDAAMHACKALSKYCGEGGGEKASTTLLGILFQFATNLSDAVKKYDKRLELEAKREAQNKKMEQQKRRKNFVESKGFGNSVAAIPAADLPPRPKQATSDVPSDDSQVVDTTKAATEETSNVDLSQLQGNAKAKVIPKSKDGSSLVLMVNQLLKEASPQAKMDFENGVVYNDVEDETLKAIYEKERLSLSTAFRSPPRRKPLSSNLDILSAIKQRREFGEDDSANVH